MKKNLEKLEKILEIKFKNKELLKKALIHRSWLNEHPGEESNERLEFLGDAVLELVVSEHLYKNFSFSEGEMTGIRSVIVNTQTLFEVAKKMKLKEWLFLSKGAFLARENQLKSILASALEAIIGAIYLDGGLKEAQKFIQKNILVFLPKIIKKGFKDPKTLLQEVTQEKFGLLPQYKILKEWGKEHKKKFLAGVYLKEKLLGEGKGFSKKEAEEKAAKIALEKIKENFNI